MISTVSPSTMSTSFRKMTGTENNLNHDQLGKHFIFRNLYECPAAGPKHMSVAVNKWKYRLQYQKYFGGVTTLSRNQYKKINGFANLFYGWGGEDDDLSHRVQKHNLTIQRSPANIARFSMLKHDKVSMNDDLENLMEKSKKSELDTDGLTTLKYKIVDHKDFPLYTWIKVDLPKGPGKRKKSWFEGYGILFFICDLFSNSIIIQVERQSFGWCQFGGGRPGKICRKSCNKIRRRSRRSARGSQEPYLLTL